MKSISTKALAYYTQSTLYAYLAYFTVQPTRPTQREMPTQNLHGLQTYTAYTPTDLHGLHTYMAYKPTRPTDLNGLHTYTAYIPTWPTDLHGLNGL